MHCRECFTIFVSINLVSIFLEFFVNVKIVFFIKYTYKLFLELKVLLWKKIA